MCRSITIPSSTSICFTCGDLHGRHFNVSRENFILSVNKIQIGYKSSVQGSNQALLACRADTLSFAAATLLWYRRHAADMLNKERHAADTLEIIV